MHYSCSRRKTLQSYAIAQNMTWGRRHESNIHLGRGLALERHTFYTTQSLCTIRKLQRDPNLVSKDLNASAVERPAIETVPT